MKTSRVILNPENFPHPVWSEGAHPPKQLYVEGADQALALLHQLPRQGLAVVGTRRPLPRSQTFLEREWQRLPPSTHLIILSGLARGVDTLAHEGALSRGLPTVAFLACGLDHTYPPENFPLRLQILQSGGLIISEYAPHEPPLKWRFIQRNRLIAQFSQAVAVIEAEKSSGAMSTASWAAKLGRFVYAVPGFPSDPALSGNERLLDHSDIPGIPFFGLHSLDTVWPGLSNELIRPASSTVQQSEFSFRRSKLQELLLRWTCERGGFTRDDVMSAALHAHESPEKWITELQLFESNGWVQKRGRLLATRLN